MDSLAKKYPYSSNQYSISHQSHQIIATSNIGSNNKWHQLISWFTTFTTSSSPHQVDSSLIRKDETTSDLQPLTSKSSISLFSTSSSLTLNHSTSTSSSLGIKILSLLIFFLTLFAVIFFTYQTGFYLLLLRNLQSSSSYCDENKLSNSQTSNKSQTKHSSQSLALQSVLSDPEHTPIFPIDLTLNLTDLIHKKSRTSGGGVSVEKCSHYSCFDIYRCGIANYQSLELLQELLLNENIESQIKNDHHHHHHQQQHRNSLQHIKVYVYPHYRFVNKDTGDDLLPVSRQQQSTEFSRILKAIVGSRYFTHNPAHACLFVLNLDLLNLADEDESSENYLKNVERILWSLPSFAAFSGANHLLFSMLFPATSAFSNKNAHQVHPQLGLNIGQAMVAAAGFSLSTYRDQFDVALPVYSLFGQLHEDESGSQIKPVPYFNPTFISRVPRQWTVVSPQANLINDGSGDDLQQLEAAHPEQVLLLQSNCDRKTLISPNRQVESQLFAHLSQRNNTENENSFSFSIARQLYTTFQLCNPARKITSLYLDLLHNSEFCLILDSTSSSSSPSSSLLLLSDALMSGCIPVILADNLILPLEQTRINWPTASVRVWEHSTSELMSIIGTISAKRRAQLRANGLYLWRKYFASIESIATTTLDIINERVYPTPKAVFAPVETGKANKEKVVENNKVYQQHPQPYSELRQQSLDFFSTGGYQYIVGQEAALRSTGFTAVILSYNRPESLFDVILSVARAPSCVKIVVVWNGDAALPKDVRWPSLPATPIQVVLAGSNKLSNRFYPYESIETEAVFSIDDDIAMLTADEIEFAYQTWRQFPDRIVGFPSRRHFWDNRTVSGNSKSHRWTYDSEWRNEISLILTGAAFYHSVSLKNIKILKNFKFFFCFLVLQSFVHQCNASIHPRVGRSNDELRRHCNELSCKCF